jgi:hypothetical protein
MEYAKQRITRYMKKQEESNTKDIEETKKANEKEKTFLEITLREAPFDGSGTRRLQQQTTNRIGMPSPQKIYCHGNRIHMKFKHKKDCKDAYATLKDKKWFKFDQGGGLFINTIINVHRRSARPESYKRLAH